MEFKDRHLIIGKGQIGTSLYEVLRKHLNVFIRDIDGPAYDKIDVLHIAIPYTPNFVSVVGSYIEQYAPSLTIVYSTLPIGTCEQISDEVVHSPVEGRHPHLAESIQIGVRWIGCADPGARLRAAELWAPFVKTVRTLMSANLTEFLKIRSTAKFGINLVWADYEDQICEQIGLDFGAVNQFDSDYNDLYDALGFPQFKRYLIDPPHGEIGGHCVVPNAELLNEQFPHPLLEMIIKMKKEEGK